MKTHLLNEVQDVVKPLEGRATVTESHPAPEEDGVEHQMPHTQAQLVCHSEPLLGPHKIPVSIAQCPEDSVQREITTTIPRVQILLHMKVSNLRLISY